MVSTKELRARAKKYEIGAAYWKERLYKKERFSGYTTPKEINALVNKAIDKDKGAMEIYNSLGDIKKVKKIKEDILKLRKPSSSQRPQRPNRLERNLGFAIIAMISLVSALFFSVFSLTGSVVQGLNENNSRWIGIILFVVGLLFTFLYNRTKK